MGGELRPAGAVEGVRRGALQKMVSSSSVLYTRRGRNMLARALTSIEVGAVNTARGRDNDLTTYLPPHLLWTGVVQSCASSPRVCSAPRLRPRRSSVTRAAVEVTWTRATCLSNSHRNGCGPTSTCSFCQGESENKEPRRTCKPNAAGCFREPGARPQVEGRGRGGLGRSGSFYAPRAPSAPSLAAGIQQRQRNKQDPY